jgi:hypothetical protein
MTNSINKRHLAQLLTVAVLGGSAVLGFSRGALADSDDRDGDKHYQTRNGHTESDRNSRRDGRDWDRDGRDGQHRNDSRDSHEGWKSNNGNGHNGQGDNHQRSRQDQRWNDGDHRFDNGRDNHHSNNGYWNGNHSDNSKHYGNTPNSDWNRRNQGYRGNNGSYGNGSYNNDRNDYRTFTGTVTKVEDDQFDIRADGVTYNVSTTRVPRGLDRGDVVRVYGERFGNNDIRNASVTIVNNR